MCRRWLIMVLVLSLPDAAVTAQSRQQEKTVTSEQVAAGSVTRGRRYHSDYFGFTYSLPDRFVDRTEEYRRRIRALPGASHSDAAWSILLVAEEPVDGTNIGTIVVRVDSLMRYTLGPIPKDYTKGGMEREYIHDLVTKAWTDAGDDLLEEGHEVSVSGKRFFRADYKVNGSPMRGYRIEMITFQKGFALGWTFFAQSRAEVDSMANLIQGSFIAKYK